MVTQTVATVIQALTFLGSNLVYAGNASSANVIEVPPCPVWPAGEKALSPASGGSTHEESVPIPQPEDRSGTLSVGE